MRGSASDIFTKWRKPRASRGAVAVALVLHAGLIFMIGSIVFSYPLREFLRIPDWSKEPPPERIQFVRVVPATGASTSADTGGVPSASPPPPRGTSTQPSEAKPLRAPVATPSELPPPDQGGTREGVEGGVPGGRGSASGAATGVTPSYSDPRLWVAPGPFVPVPKTMAQKTDSIVRDLFGVYVDSVRVAQEHAGRAPGDWTVEKGGQKWGVDPKWVHLGKVKIPTAVLAMLPLNAQGNPAEIDRQRAQAYRRQDINFQAHRAVNEDEFRRAVKRIRERKDRERAEEEKARRDIRP
jgi:hypothetical protein